MNIPWLFRSNKTLPMLLFLFPVIFSCATTQPINDFFGIGMDESQFDHFIINSYSVEKGVSYESTADMNPLIYAWAEIEANKIRIKVVNDTNDPIAINYNLDRFTLVTTRDEEFILSKGQSFDYPKQTKIAPNNFFEFVMNLPSDFWSTVGMTDQQSVTANYTKEFWTGNNKLSILKENLKVIRISLAGKLTLYLKPVVL
ncbi:MAG: hypothetical protein ACOY90_06010 [Candidatus Zhuqueibacterota bacterium]